MYVVDVKLALVEEEGAEVQGSAVYPCVTCGAVAWHLAVRVYMVVL